MDPRLALVTVAPLLMLRLPPTMLKIPALRFRAVVSVIGELMIAEVPALSLFMLSVFSALPPVNVNGEVSGVLPVSVSVEDASEERTPLEV